MADLVATDSRAEDLESLRRGWMEDNLSRKRRHFGLSWRGKEEVKVEAVCGARRTLASANSRVNDASQTRPRPHPQMLLLLTTSDFTLNEKRLNLCRPRP